jgi:hypothetical protein
MRRSSSNRKNVKVNKAKSMTAPNMMEAAGHGMRKSHDRAATLSFTQPGGKKFIRGEKYYGFFRRRQ